MGSAESREKIKMGHRLRVAASEARASEETVEKLLGVCTYLHGN